MKFSVESKIKFDTISESINVINRLTETNIKNIEVKLIKK